MQAVTNIQYELFMVLSTVGSFTFDTQIHLTVLKLDQKKKQKTGNRSHGCSDGYAW